MAASLGSGSGIVCDGLEVAPIRLDGAGDGSGVGEDGSGVGGDGLGVGGDGFWVGTMSGAGGSSPDG